MNKYGRITILENGRVHYDVLVLEKPITFEEMQLHCGDIITMPCRTVGGVPFYFVVDDCGLLRDNPKLALFVEQYETALFGNVLICRVDNVGETIGLTDEELQIIQDNMFYTTTYNAYIILS